MWKQKIGISLDTEYTMPKADVVRMLADIGFDAVSPEWTDEAELSETVEAAHSRGIEIQSLHAPFGKSDDMWNPDNSVSGPAKAELLSVLESCRKFNIPTMVMHAWIGFGYKFGETAHGIKNYGEIVAKAAEYGIKIAFENTEGEEYLFALLDSFSGAENVGFCWDSGHEMCYNHSADLLARYGDRLIMTHLNDNLGISRFDGETFWTDDLHLLPYDGIADWDYNIGRLKKSQHQQILNFELNNESKPNRHENDNYAKMSLDEFYTEAYKMACRIAYRYAETVKN